MQTVLGAWLGSSFSSALTLVQFDGSMLFEGFPTLRLSNFETFHAFGIFEWLGLGLVSQVTGLESQLRDLGRRLRGFESGLLGLELDLRSLGSHLRGFGWLLLSLGLELRGLGSHSWRFGSHGCDAEKRLQWIEEGGGRLDSQDWRVRGRDHGGFLGVGREAKGGID